MTYNVITQEGMVVGSQKTLEDARDLAEDIDGVIIDENNNAIPETEEVKTSIELYSKIQKVIDEIDSFFFSGKGKQKLPEVVFAINERCKACVLAYVSPEALYDKAKAKKLQYLAINPAYLNRDSKEILATICHELCHVYEHAYIHIPRGGYHDKQWAELMRDCGLEPIYNNKSKTSVHHKIIEGGAFEDFVKQFKEEHGEDYFNIVSYSSEVERQARKALGLEEGEGEDEGELGPDNADKPVKKYNRNKIKYTCPECKAKVWGKAGLNIYCSDCECSFEEEVEDEDN